MVRRFVAPPSCRGVKYTFPTNNASLLYKLCLAWTKRCVSSVPLVKRLAVSDEMRTNFAGYMSSAGVQHTMDVLKRHTGLNPSLLLEVENGPL